MKSAVFAVLLALAPVLGISQASAERTGKCRSSLTEVVLAQPGTAVAAVSNPEKNLFGQAIAAFKAKRYDVANLKFQTLVNTYPNSEYAPTAKLFLRDPRIANCGRGLVFGSGCNGGNRGEPTH